MSPSRNFQTTYAVSIDDSDNIYSVQTDGYITVFDSEGNLLFRFGGTSNDERFGSLSNPVAISALADGRIMVLDKNYNMVITYSRTEFADLVFSAVDYYKDGLYLEGEDLWNEVLRYNSNFILARAPIDHKVLVDGLKERGVLIRDFGSKRRTENCVRTTVGTAELNAILLEKTEEVLSGCR